VDGAAAEDAKNAPLFRQLEPDWPVASPVR